VPEPSELVKITGLLKAWAGGDLAAQRELIPLVYRQLHEIASRYRRKAGRSDSRACRSSCSRLTSNGLFH